MYNNIIFFNSNIYHPKSEAIELFIEQTKLDKFLVCFNETNHQPKNLKKLSQLSINAIALLNEKERERESEKFYMFLITNPRNDIKEYLQPLLNYFHMIGYLKFKKSIYNHNKQKIVRYIVEFKNKEGKLLIKKKYSSLEQLSDDIGKKMTTLHYQLFKTSL